MPRMSAGMSRSANVAPTARIESDAASVSQPIATWVTDQANPPAAPLNHSAVYPATRKAASVTLDPRPATARARSPLGVTPLRRLLIGLAAGCKRRTHARPSGPTEGDASASL